MNEMITIGKQQIGEGSIQTVNARDLHEFLGVKKDFSDWIKAQVKRAKLVENLDYVVFPQKGENGGRPTSEYHLTLESGKHVSMMSGAERGREVRDYFIECEKIALAPPQQTPIQALNDPASLRALLLTNVEKVIALESKVAEQAPTIAAFDRIANADGMMCITDTAKVLHLQPRMLFAWMFENGWIYRRVGNKNRLAYQPRLQQGVLFHKVSMIPLADGTERIQESVKVTAKGLAKLAEVFAVREAA